MVEKRFLQVYMDLNNKCNLKCRMCYFSKDVSDLKPELMGLDLFEKIAEEVFPTAASLNLSCAAEPFLIPNFNEYLKITAKYSIPSTLLVTNGQLLSRKFAVSMIENNLDQIDISIDGATKKTYEWVRPGSSFERLLENIWMLQSLKKEMGKDNPRLFIDSTIMRSTIDELVELLYLAKDLGVDTVRVSHLIPFKFLENLEESLVFHKEKTNEIFDKARAMALKLSMRVLMPPNFDLNKEEGLKKKIFNKPYCTIPFNSMHINSSGKVIPCIWFPFTEWCAGDFKRQSLDEIWNGEIYSRLRGSFEKKDFTEYCINCPVYTDESIDNYVFEERERKDVINIFKG